MERELTAQCQPVQPSAAQVADCFVAMTEHGGQAAEVAADSSAAHVGSSGGDGTAGVGRESHVDAAGVGRVTEYYDCCGGFGLSGQPVRAGSIRLSTPESSAADIAVLDEALATLDEDDPEQRVRVLSRLAQSTPPSVWPA